MKTENYHFQWFEKENVRKTLRVSFMNGIEKINRETQPY